MVSWAWHRARAILVWRGSWLQRDATAPASSPNYDFPLPGTPATSVLGTLSWSVLFGSEREDPSASKAAYGKGEWCIGHICSEKWSHWEDPAYVEATAESLPQCPTSSKLPRRFVPLVKPHCDWSCMINTLWLLVSPLQSCQNREGVQSLHSAFAVQPIFVPAWHTNQ